MGRAPCCDKASVKRGPWSPEEDELLRSYVQNHGTGGNWIALPHKAGLNRCGKSCRLRWLNYLRPDIKHGGYTEQEDRIICSLYSSIGSRWSIIASKLPGRTDNDVKNYWNTKLKKKALAIHNQTQQSQQQEYYHHQAGASATGRGRDSRRRAFVTTPPPPPAHQQTQCASSMQPSPTPVSPAVTTANDAGSFVGAATTMYSSLSAAALQTPPPALAIARYVDAPQQHAAPSSSLAEFPPAPQPTTTNNSSWAAAATGAECMALEDMFLPELLGAEFPPTGVDLLGFGAASGGFGPLLLQDHHRVASSALQELSACYFPNAPAELWADVKPPAGLCHSLT